MFARAEQRSGDAEEAERQRERHGDEEAAVDAPTSTSEEPPVPPATAGPA